MPDYQITGPWVPADGSANHFECARTSVSGVIALRNTFTPSAVLYGTPDQFYALASSINSGQMSSLGLRG